jgi:hypothetical protein
MPNLDVAWFLIFAIGIFVSGILPYSILLFGAKLCSCRFSFDRGGDVH